MSRIAKSSFLGAPTDRLEAADVYQRTAPVTKDPQPTSEPPLTALLDQDRQTTQPSMKETEEEKRAREKEAAKKAIHKTLKGGRGSVEAVGMDMMDVIYDSYIGPQYGEVIPDPRTLVKNVRANIDDTEKVVDGGDFDTVEGVANFLKDVSGSEIFTAVNLGAEAALVNGTLEKLSEWGVPEILDKALEKLKKDVKEDAASRQVQRFVDAGDIDSVEVMLKHVGPEVLLSRQPSVPKELLRRYRFKEGTTPGDYPDRLAQLVRVMDQLAPLWFWTYRGEERVWNLAYLAVASDDAQILLKSHDTYRTAVMIARHYPEKRPQVLLRAMYPMIAITA